MNSLENLLLLTNRVESLSITDDHTKLALKLKDLDTEIVLEAYGGCCSRSWIEHISGIDALIDSEIYSVEDVYLADVPLIGLPSTENVDQVTYYATKIHTSKGVFQIDYRNDSNGYYGGSLEAYERSPAKGLETQLLEDF